MKWTDKDLDDLDSGRTSLDDGETEPSYAPTFADRLAVGFRFFDHEE